MSDKGTILYSRGQKALEAHIVSSGPVTVVFETDLALTVDGIDLIVGTLEYFLQKGDCYELTRIADVIAPFGARPDSVPILELPNLLEEYELGLQSNIFLAKLIQEANSQIQGFQADSSISKQLRLSAMVYYRFTELINTFACHSRVQALFKLVEENSKKRLYQLGAALYAVSAKPPVTVNINFSNRFIERFEAKELVCKQGDKDEKLFILLKGKVSVIIDGLEVATISQPGEAFGELSLLLEGERTATLKTVEASDFYVIPRSGLMEFYKERNSLFTQMGKTLTKRLVNTVAQVELVKLQQPQDSSAKELERSLALLRTFANNLDYVQLKESNRALADLAASLNRSIKSLS